MKHQPPSVVQRFKKLRVGDAGISAITLAELEHGVGSEPKLATKRRNQLDRLLQLTPALEFDALAARSYGDLRNRGVHLGRHRFDTLIAAHAISQKLILVTNNMKDFSGIEGLLVENWVINCS
jgi:tRNA(fMet)-specific endonuclease VapC